MTLGGAKHVDMAAVAAANDCNATEPFAADSGAEIGGIWRTRQGLFLVPAEDDSAGVE